MFDELNTSSMLQNFSIKEKSGLEVNTNWDLTSLVEQEAISLITHLAK